MIESKAIGGTDGSQLWRHARAFGLPQPRRQGGGLVIPDAWRQQRWEDVATWASNTDDQNPVARFLLSELAEYLALAGVLTERSPRSRATVAVRRDPAQEFLLEQLAETSDLDAIALACRDLYGDPQGSHYVHGDQETGHTHTTDDSRRVRELYRSAREPVPPHLTVSGGNVITARRALCIAYGPKRRFMQSVATPNTRDAAGRSGRRCRPRRVAWTARLGLAARRGTCRSLARHHRERMGSRTRPRTRCR